MLYCDKTLVGTTEYRCYIRMGRKKNENRKGHKQCQRDYVDRLKKKLGEELYRRRDADRKIESRKRLWESYSSDRKEMMREKARHRGAKFREKKRQKKAMEEAARNKKGIEKKREYTNLASMRKYKKVMCEETQQTEAEGRNTCLAVRGEDMIDDCEEDGDVGEIPREQNKEEFKTLHIKEEELEDYYGEGDTPKEKSDLHPLENREYSTNFMNEDDFEDEWIEDYRSEGEQQPADEEGLPYHVHIKEEVSEDEYQENDYQGEDTADMEMMAHSSSKEDESSCTEDNSEIVRSSVGISRRGGPVDVGPYNESETNGKVSEENLPLKSDTFSREESVRSTRRSNYNDYLQVLWVEEVDTVDSDFYHEHGQKNALGEMDCSEEIQQYSMCTTRSPDESSPSRRTDTYEREKRFECPECHKRYTEKRSLMRHMEAHSTDKSYKCSLCGKEFSSEGRLLAHMRCHVAGRSFECSYCNKGFTDKCGLTRHIRTHTGERPYKCSLCDRSFSVKGNLAQHMKTHSGEKPFTCAICDKRFLHQSWLSRHVYRAHSGVHIKPYQCCVCEKCFSQNSDLTRHMKTHTRKKHFECAYCDKTFSTSGNFARHERTHEEAREVPRLSK